MYKQFLQVSQLYRALSLLGVVFYLPSASVSSVFSLHGAIYMYIYIFFKLIASSLPFSELSMEELALELVD